MTSDQHRPRPGLLAMRSRSSHSPVLLVMVALTACMVKANGYDSFRAVADIPLQVGLAAKKPASSGATSFDLTEPSSWRTIAIGLLAIFVTYKLIPNLFSVFQPDPHAVIPAAVRRSWLKGNFGSRETDEYDGQNLVTTAKELNSPVYFLPAPMGRTILVLGDNAAINHVLHDVNKFPSTVFRREFIRFAVGGGVIVATGKDHARQRRVMGPAFTQSHIRTLAPIFTTKAEELGDKVVELARKGGHAVWTDAGPGQTPGKDTPAVLNMSELLDCASFDVIGKAGFGIDFDCIQHGLANVELANGYNKMLKASATFDFPRFLLLIFSGLTRPSWLALPLNKPNRIIRAQKVSVERLAEHVLDRKMKHVQAIMDDAMPVQNEAGGEPVDLMEMICRSNAQLQRKGQTSAMTLDELRGVVRTLLFAGYETSSVTTSMTLWFLANNQRIHKRLQTELLGYLAKRKADRGGVEEPLRAEELQGEEMTLLSNCIKETLRLAPAVTMTDREATEDCVIPLGRPIPRSDGKGSLTQLNIRKGTQIGTCLKLPNVEPHYWGPDPERWDPERWEHLPETYKEASMPGPAGLTTFSNGPASCIGSRFAMLEIAAFLVSILRRVRLEPSPSYDVSNKPVIVTRPVVKGKGVVALPLRIIPLQ